MPRRVYTAEERAALLFHYLNEFGLEHEDEDGRSCLVRNPSGIPSRGQALLRVFPEAATFSYTLPLPQPMPYRAALLEQLNDLNERHHWEMTFYLISTARGWVLRIDGLIAYRGCSRAAARRAASLIQCLLSMVGRSVYELQEALPDEFSDAALQKAQEDFFRELCEEDFVIPEDRELSEEEPAPEFDFTHDDPAEEAPLPDWPEAWGDEEALIARYEAEGPDALSGYDLIKLDLAYKRLLARKKQRLSEALDEMNRSNPHHF